MMPRLVTVFYLLGALLAFVSQRYQLLAQEGLWIGSVLLGLTTLLTGLRYLTQGRASIDGARFVWQSLGVIAWASHLFGQKFEDGSLGSFLTTALFLAGLTLAFILALRLEIADLKEQADDAQDAVSRRVQGSFALGLLLLGLIALNWSAHKRDVSRDFSYLKTSQAGDATRKAVAALTQEVEVAAFFSRDSDVLPFVREYLEPLAGDRLKIYFYDRDLNPGEAESFRVARNGQIVLRLGEKRQRFEVGNKLEDARRSVRTLDSAFLRELFKLTRDPAIVYFVASHGEMSFEADRNPPLRSTATLEELLRTQNFRSRRLSSTFREIPADAEIVALLGPVTSFLPEETAALSRFLERGGSLLLALDIDSYDERGAQPLKAADALPAFLQSYGLTYNRTPVAHDERFVANTRQLSDRYFLISTHFQKHPAAATLSANADRLNFLSFRTGSWDVGTPPAGWTVQTPILAMKGSFRDANGNFEADPNEGRASFPLSVVLENDKGGRFALFSDATAFSDVLLKSTGNQFAILDALRWLADRSSDSGLVESEEDVLIQHENLRELAIFHSSIYLLPGLVLAIGFWVNRRRRRPKA